MGKNTDAEVILIGAGMAGLSLGGLLSQQGLRVTIIDREDPSLMATAAFDARTIALSAGTMDVLSPLGINKNLLAHGEAIRVIDVQEGFDPFVLNFDTSDIGEQAFGWILPNTAVRSGLYEACLKHGVTFVTGHSVDSVTATDTHGIVTLENGTILQAPLVVAADGRHSLVRQLLGIDVVQLAYHHTAYVGFITHTQPHHGLALERFYPSGPFAALPFTDTTDGLHRSAIVWSRHQRDIKRDPINVTDLDTITDRIREFVDERYGEIEAVGKWATYPLSLCHAKQMIGPRIALISDAAHAIHPIAGQGLNLGMRDIAYLAQHIPQAKAAKNDWGSDDFLSAYQRARRFDVFQMVAATDILTRLFGVSFPPLRWARSAGLGLVNRVPPLKKFFMRQAMGR